MSKFSWVRLLVLGPLHGSACEPEDDVPDGYGYISEYFCTRTNIEYRGRTAFVRTYKGTTIETQVLALLSLPDVKVTWR